MILGPSGAGKSFLAKLIHDSSARKAHPFLPLSADDIVGGDETIRRVRWAGYGKNSGLSGVSGTATQKGWLRETERGTIFIDELYDLDSDSMSYLRGVLDGKLFRPAVGEGQEFPVNVRLVFATYRSIAELNAKMLPDFARRLKDRYLVVPALQERVEDIPLFIERFREGRKPDEAFILALLLHDWQKGQVDELITAIRDAVVRKGPGEKLLHSDLADAKFNSVVAKVGGMDSAQIEIELYSRLIQAFKRQGLAAGKRGSGLQTRLAQVLAKSPATVSRRIGVLSLKSLVDA